MTELPKDKEELIQLFIQKLEVNFDTANTLYSKGYDSVDKLLAIELEALADIDEIDVKEAKNIYQNAKKLAKELEFKEQLAEEKKAREEEGRQRAVEEAKKREEERKRPKHIDRLITPVDELRGRIMEKTKEVVDTIVHPPEELPEEEPKVVIVAGLDEEDEEDASPVKPDEEKKKDEPVKEDVIADFMRIKGVTKKEASFLYEIGFDGVAHLIHEVVRQEWEYQRKKKDK